MRFFVPFLWHAIRSDRQARAAAGNIVAIERRSGSAYWTLSVWHDKAAMRAFMLNGSHRAAMPHLVQWCDEASTCHWDQASGDLPSWTEAERRLAAEGRVSAVKYPSAAQAAGATLGTVRQHGGAALA